MVRVDADIRLGPQVCSSLEEGSRREWLVADGLGGYAMGTVPLLRTRRYHGLLVVATEPPIGRRLALACLDPVLVLGDRRVRLAIHEWASGAVDPAGHVFLESFEVREGVPRWRYAVGEVSLEISAWAGSPGERPPPASAVVARARRRAGERCRAAGAATRTERLLTIAADRHVVAGPTVVAGYPWFGEWSRDTMIAYEGLMLATNRADEGRKLLERAAAGLSEGMLSNTADEGGTRYNTVDATLWFVHALHRHVTVTGDIDLAAALAGDVEAILRAHVEGTRYGIKADDDGLLAAGAPGEALTWMDARVDGEPVTQRAGKPVEVNALWVNALAAGADLLRRTGHDGSEAAGLLQKAASIFAGRYLRHGGGLADVVDGPAGDDGSLRPNQLLAVSLPFGPVRDAGPVLACAPLVTPLGLRSLAPDDPAYCGRHRGGPAERDHAYHEGTVWPYLIGPYVEARRRTGLPCEGLLDPLFDHLGEWGLGSVSETADGDAPHGATGCPFQAWSVAELLRASKLPGGGA